MVKLKRVVVPALLASVLTLGGCVFFHSASISDSAGTGSTLTAQASDMGYLRLIAPPNLTDAAATQLQNQCQSGKLTNVETELSMRDFLGIVQMYQVDATGICM